jgi:hypothetical protein
MTTFCFLVDGFWFQFEDLEETWIEVEELNRNEFSFSLLSYLFIFKLSF